MIIIRTDDGMQHLLQSKFKLGADASATAGPVGRDAQASTDLTLRAQVLTYSRSRGLFLGVSLSCCPSCCKPLWVTRPCSADWCSLRGAYSPFWRLPIVGRLTQKVEARWMVAFGLGVTGLALLHMSTFNLQLDIWTAVRAWTFSRIGMAFLFIPINVTAFYFIPKEKMNNATGIINLARNIGGSVGIANVATLLSRRAQVHQAMLVAHLTPYDAPLPQRRAGRTANADDAGFQLPRSPTSSRRACFTATWFARPTCSPMSMLSRCWAGRSSP